VLKRLVDVTNAIYLANDRDSLFKALEEGAAAFGFNGFLLSCHKPTKQEMILNATLTNFSEAFLADYERFEWTEDDFILDAALETRQPLVWDTSQLRHGDIRKQNYLDFIHANELLSGVIVPLKHRTGSASAFTLCGATDKASETGMIEAANIMANAAMAKAEILGLHNEVSIDAAKATQALSTVQTEILNWIAEGKSNLDIATIVGLNERTIRYHVTEILRKLGVATRMQAAAIHQKRGAA